MKALREVPKNFNMRTQHLHRFVLRSGLRFIQLSLLWRGRGENQKENEEKIEKTEFQPFTVSIILNT